VLERFGAVPLPPYITHAPQAEDAERYQTVYAAVPGAVAAPTAGLHFDAAMLERLRKGGARLAKVTLHVGVGTFQPVRSERVEDHRMHLERYTIPRETMDALRGRRVLAVGTTSLRALETAAQTGELSGETGLFVYPGFRFRSSNRLLTNFHLPRSTLLMLVSAFAGKDHIFARTATPSKSATVLLLRRRDAHRKMNFKLTHRDGQARRGVLELAHARVDTRRSCRWAPMAR